MKWCNDLVNLKITTQKIEEIWNIVYFVQTSKFLPVKVFKCNMTTCFLKICQF